MRPNYPLQFFADASIFSDNQIKDAKWGGGVSWEVIDGVRLNGRYMSDKVFTVGFDLSMGSYGVGYRSVNNKDSKNNFGSYSLRFGSNDRAYFKDISPIKYFVKLDLNGGVKYQTYQYFDNSQTLKNILDKLDLVEQKPEVLGVVVNTSGMAMSPAIAWEIRDKLSELKAKGKTVFVYIDRIGIGGYYFAVQALSQFYRQSRLPDCGRPYYEYYDRL